MTDFIKVIANSICAISLFSASYALIQMASPTFTWPGIIGAIVCAKEGFTFASNAAGIFSGHIRS